MIMAGKLKPPRIPERQRNESICWFCKNAVPTRNENGNFVTGCEWSIRKQPVPGWQSIDKVRKRLGLDEYYTAHKVQACPKFERG